MGGIDNGSNGQVLYGRRIPVPGSLSAILHSFLYLGAEEDVVLRNFLLTFPHKEFLVYNPKVRKAKCLSISDDKVLKRRHYLVEKARDAKVIGFVINSLNIAGIPEIVKHLRNLVKLAGKKSYVISIGKMNEAKVLNFPEVDVFVVIACMQSSLIDSKDFMHPIITPHELEIAMNPDYYLNHLILDFSQILPG